MVRLKLTAETPDGALSKRLPVEMLNELQEEEEMTPNDWCPLLVTSQCVGWFNAVMLSGAQMANYPQRNSL